VKAAAVAGILALLALSAAAASAGTSAGRVVDRTFVCTPFATFGGQRDLDVSVQPPYRDAQTSAPATIFVKSGPYSPSEQLVAVRARPAQRFGSNPYRAGVYAHTARCAGTGKEVPLSAKGLAGPPVVWAKLVDCDVRGRIFVRVRAELVSPSAWRPVGTPYAGAVGNVASAQLAVRSEKSGKPIAYATFGADGKTKFWAAAGCS
jgi:hypothetical protein